MSTIGGLYNTGSVRNLRALQGISVIITPFNSCRIFQRLSLISYQYVLFHTSQICAIWLLSMSLSILLPYVESSLSVALWESIFISIEFFLALQQASFQAKARSRAQTSYQYIGLDFTASVLRLVQISLIKEGNFSLSSGQTNCLYYTFSQILKQNIYFWPRIILQDPRSKIQKGILY